MVEDLGQLLVHGIAIRPGHPVVLGLAEGKPLIGLPGYPVSAALTADLLVKPLLQRWQGQPESSPRQVISAQITRKVLSPMGEDEFLRVKLGRVGEKMVATPVQRGAGVIMSLVRADGLARIPRFSEGLDAGAMVNVELLRPLEEVENTIVAIGSHDLNPGLDVQPSPPPQPRPDPDPPPTSAAWADWWPCGGARRTWPAATCWTKPPANTTLPTCAATCPGLPVAAGSPGGTGAGLNRPARQPDADKYPGRPAAPRRALCQPAAGFRHQGAVGLQAERTGRRPELIRGYDREEYSHLAVAAAVKGGSADAGLGILSAAQALNLDFVPLLTEQYDLVIPRFTMKTIGCNRCFPLLRDEEFRQEVANLGGYDVANMGRVAAELG